MAALTYTGQRKAYVRPTRTFDHLYDPVYRVSSNRDHMKDCFKAQTAPEKIRYMPKFKTMFSALRHRPRLTVTLDMTDPVPSHVSRQWNGFADQAREAMVRYKKFNYNPAVQIPPKQFEPADVDGVNRYKYFRRPIIPFLPQMPPNVVLAPARMDPLQPPLSPSTTAAASGQGLFHGPRTRSVLVQTDYRESEAQTDPYSPEHVVRPGSQPELLTLASLSYGRGLPAGLAEVEMIERARVKRAWEASLPSLDDLQQMDKRRRMMEEQERKEWAFREQEIAKMQEERMDLLKKMLQQREVDHYALNSKRMEHFWAKKSVERDRCNRRLHSNHVKALRKLTEQVSRVEGKFEKRDVIQQYSNFDSQVYAPMTRIGVYLDSGSEQYNVKSKFSTTLDGLMELEENLPPDMLRARFTPPVRSALKAVGMEARRQVKLGSILEHVYSEIISSKTEGKKEQKPLRLLKKVEKPLPRPITPTIPMPMADEEEKELALILLQRIIRGRAIQTKMFEGKERRQQLIQELRTTHALQSPEQKAQRIDAENIRRKQVEQARQQHMDNVVQDGSELPAATHIGKRLDFLTKELLRLQEERRIHAYVMLAERERRVKEAEESGRRQREERIRRTEDEMFKQMMRVQQGTVDTYLQDVIIESLERTADQEARKEIAEKAKAINKVAHEFEHTELSGKELVAELVYAFLLPAVDRKALQERVEREQRKHLLAAHRIILQKVNDVVLPKLEGQADSSERVTSPSEDSHVGPVLGAPIGDGEIPVRSSIEERQAEQETPTERAPTQQSPRTSESHSPKTSSQVASTLSQEGAPPQELRSQHGEPSLGTEQSLAAEDPLTSEERVEASRDMHTTSEEPLATEELAEPSQEIPTATEELSATEKPAEPSQELPTATEEPLATEELAEPSQVATDKPSEDQGEEGTPSQEPIGDGMTEADQQ